MKWILLMTAAIHIGLAEADQRLIEAWQDRPRDVVESIDAGVEDVLIDIENHLKLRLFTGGVGPGGGRLPVGSRSPDGLRQDITHERTDRFGGTVGTTERTSAYAKPILGPDTTTIRPRDAGHLWVPTPDNLDPSGNMRHTPRDVMSLLSPTGKRRARFFYSKRGKLVVFLPDQRGGTYTKGKKKGQMRGDLLFVLKDEVVIHGTDALAKAFEDRRSESERILSNALREGLA